MHAQGLRHNKKIRDFTLVCIYLFSEAPLTRRRCENDRYETVPIQKEILPDRPPVYTKTIRFRKLFRRYEDDRKHGHFWRRYGINMPSSSCKHHIRIDRSGSYQTVMGIDYPRTQASNLCIFCHTLGYKYGRVGISSESIKSFKARSWQGVAMRHKEEQCRAVADLLILLIVAQALLLLLFKALCIAHLQVTSSSSSSSSSSDYLT